MKLIRQALAFAGGFIFSLIMWEILTALKSPLLFFLGLGTPLLSYYGKSYVWLHFNPIFVAQIYAIIAVTFLIANSLVLWLVPSLPMKKGLLLGYLLVFMTGFQWHSYYQEHLDPGLSVGNYFSANQTLESDIVDALENSSQKRCNNMKSGEFRGMCVAIFARQKKDPRICLTLSKEISPYGRSEVDDCLWELINVLDSETVCSLMINPKKSASCFSSVFANMSQENIFAEVKKKPHFPENEVLELCIKLNEDNPFYHERIECLRNTAAAYGDMDVCKRMPSPSEMDICYYQVSITTDDSGACQKISYPALRNQCQVCTSSPGTEFGGECLDYHP